MDVNIEIKTINFYTTQEGKTPVVEFLDSLTAKQAQKITWVLQLVEELDVIPTTYLKKLVNTQDIWEVRAQVGNNIFRLLGFFDGDNLVVLNHCFQKKTQKTPAKDIKLAEQRRRDYLQRKKQ
ncbi:type II toxin-antitoxin system RelE/ParE family toxin [Paraglaciecola sp.]|uniref:type II toxin-antitoxin system RelE/ParE family toxin n=1 Tax=Paraglaciecola sp. TaxID=1920173 RepID=UPI003267FB37